MDSLQVELFGNSEHLKHYIKAFDTHPTTQNPGGVMLPGFFVVLEQAVPFCFAGGVVCLAFFFCLFFAS